MRKEKVKSALFSIALWAIFIALVGWMMGESSQLAAAYNSISLRYDLPVTYNEVVSARRFSSENADRDAFWPTFWGESTADFESEFNTAEGIRKIDYDGDGTLVWPATFIQGTYPSALDRDGCAISSKLAWRLWGADNVVDSNVKIGGHLYTVRGVFESGDEMALVAWGDRENVMGWTGVELAGGIENAGRSEAMKYISDAGLQQPATILNAPATVSVSPGNASESGYSWTSNEPTIAWVDTGDKLQLGRAGETTITLTSTELGALEAAGLPITEADRERLVKTFTVRVLDPNAVPFISFSAKKMVVSRDSLDVMSGGIDSGYCGGPRVVFQLREPISNGTGSMPYEQVTPLEAKYYPYENDTVSETPIDMLTTGPWGMNGSFPDYRMPRSPVPTAKRERNYSQISYVQDDPTINPEGLLSNGAGNKGEYGFMLRVPANAPESELDAQGELKPVYRLVVTAQFLGAGKREEYIDIYIKPRRATGSIEWAGEAPPFKLGDTGKQFVVKMNNLMGKIGEANSPEMELEVLHEGASLTPRLNLSITDLTKDPDSPATGGYSASATVTLPDNLTAANKAYSSYTIKYTVNNIGDEPYTGVAPFSVCDPSKTQLLVYNKDMARQNAPYNLTPDLGSFLDTPTSQRTGTVQSQELIERYSQLNTSRQVWVMDDNGNDNYSLHGYNLPKTFTLVGPDGKTVQQEYDNRSLNQWVSLPVDGKTYTLKMDAAGQYIKKSEQLTFTTPTNSLKDKLYIFDLRSGGLANNASYDVSYFLAGGNNVTKTIQAYDGRIAIYEPTGLTGSITFINADGERAGSLRAEALASGLNETAGLAAAADYPVNAVPMSFAPAVMLTFVDAAGAPVANKQVDIRLGSVDVKATGITLRDSSHQENYTATTNAQGVVRMPLTNWDFKKPASRSGVLYIIEAKVEGVNNGKPQVLFHETPQHKTSLVYVLRQEGGLYSAILDDSNSIITFKRNANDVYSYAVEDNVSPCLYVLGERRATGLKPATAAKAGATIALGAGGTALPFLQGSYALTPIDLTGHMSPGAAAQEFSLSFEGGGTERLGRMAAVPGAGQRARDTAAAVKKQLEQSIGGDGEVKGNTGGITDGATAASEVSNAFHDLDFSIPLAPLPFQFDIEKRDNDYTIRGVVSLDVLALLMGASKTSPPVPAGAEIGGEYASAFGDLFQSVVNDILDGSIGSDGDSLSMNLSYSSNSVFAGLRGYFSASAAYDPASGYLDIHFNGGGMILETSASLGSGVELCPFILFPIRYNLVLSSTTDFKNPKASEYQGVALKKGVPVLDISTTAKTEIGITVGGEVGYRAIGIGGGAGVRFNGYAGVDDMIVLRHYRPANDPKREQSGMKQYIGGKVEAYAFAIIMGLEFEYARELWSTDSTKYTPNNASNPLWPKRMSNIYTQSEPQARRLRSVPAMPGTAGAALAAAPLYSEDGGTLVFINTDGQLMAVRSGNATAVDAAAGGTKRITGSFDVAGSGSNEAIAWEDILPTDEATEISVAADPAGAGALVMNRMTLSEIYASQGGAVKKLTENSLADLMPKTAASGGGQSIVVWQQGAVSDFDLSTGDYAFDGDLVFKRYNGSSWDDNPSAILPLGIGERLLSHDVAMDAAGNALVVMEMEGGKIGYALVAADGTVTVLDSPREGSAPQVTNVTMGGESRFLIAHRASGVQAEESALDAPTDIAFFGVDSTGADDAALTFSAEIGSSSSFRFLKGASRAIEDLGLVWQTDEALLGAAAADLTSTSSLYAAAFISEGSGCALAAGKLLTESDEDTIARYDAWVNAGTITAAALYRDETARQATIGGSTGTLAGKISAAGPVFNRELVAPGASLSLGFDVTNEGSEKIERLEVSLDGGTAQSFPLAGDAQIAPRETKRITAQYTVPDTAGSTQVEIKAYFTGSTSATYTGEANIANLIDLGVEIVSIDEDTQGSKTVVAGLTSASLMKLPAGANIHFGLYEDPQGVTAIGTPETVAATDLPVIQAGGDVMGYGSVTRQFTVQTDQDVYAVARIDGTNLLDLNTMNDAALVKGTAEKNYEEDPGPGPGPGPNPGPGSTPAPQPAPTPAPGADTAAPPEVVAGSVQLNMQYKVLAPNGKVALKATVAPTDAANKTITWKSSKPNIAKVNEATGQVTALKKGTATITATTANGKTAKCTVLVAKDKAAAKKLAISSLKVTGQKSITLYQKQNKQKNQLKSITVKVTANPATAKYRKKLLWVSADPDIATVSKNGKITAGKKTGSTTITCTALEGGKSVKIRVRVKAK